VAKVEPTPAAKVEPTAPSGSIFTLEERKDGWDDVRGALKDAAKDREKPWQEVKEQYISPVSRWASVLADELRPGGGAAADTADKPQRTAAKQPEQRAVAKKAEAATEPMDKKAIVKSALATLSSVLDSAPTKQTGSARNAPAKAKEASTADLVNSGIMGGLLLGVPVSTLALLYYLATQ